jgi:hypothetical protein
LWPIAPALARDDALGTCKPNRYAVVIMAAAVPKDSITPPTNIIFRLSKTLII